MDDSAENTSGGDYGTPLEVAELHWNWGAFFLGWLWCFANGQAGLGVLLIALNCLLTYFNVALLTAGYPLPSELLALVVLGTHAYLGINGHRFAWERRRFVGGVPQFLSVQRAWAVGGLIAFVGTTLVLSLFGAVTLTAFNAYEARKQKPVAVAAPPPAATGPAPIVLQRTPPPVPLMSPPMGGPLGRQGFNHPGDFQRHFNPNYRGPEDIPGYRQPGDQAPGFQPVPRPDVVPSPQPYPNVPIPPMSPPNAPAPDAPTQPPAMGNAASTPDAPPSPAPAAPGSP